MQAPAEQPKHAQALELQRPEPSQALPFQRQVRDALRKLHV